VPPPRATQVFFWLVVQGLAVGVGVSGIHQAMFNTKILMQHLRGGARPFVVQLPLLTTKWRGIVLLVINPQQWSGHRFYPERR
jgi:hypothetical protein